MSDLVGNPEDQFSHGAAHMLSERKLPLTTPSSQSEKRLTTERVLSTLANEIARDSLGGGIKKTQSASSSPNISMFNSVPSAAPLSYKLGRYCQFHSSEHCDIYITCTCIIQLSELLLKADGLWSPLFRRNYP